MSQMVLVTGAAGGTQGSTGRLVALLLRDRGIPVRALVHNLDARTDDLRKHGAEVIEGDLLNPAFVHYYENVRALVTRSIAEQNAVFLPWGDGSAVIPLVGAADVSRVVATLLASPRASSQRAYVLVSETPTVKEIV